MARTTETNERTGEKFPRKSRRKIKSRKFFGYRYGDGAEKTVASPNAKKGIDFINDGYPFETRTKAEIEEHIQKEITEEELKNL